MRNSFGFAVGKDEWKRTNGSRQRWEGNIKLGLEEILGSEGVHWIHLVMNMKMADPCDHCNETLISIRKQGIP
jgi:hypothetical protein